MGDRNRIHFPQVPTRDIRAIGAIEDMREDTNVVPNITERSDREHLPVVFGAGGPM